MIDIEKIFPKEERKTYTDLEKSYNNKITDIIEIIENEQFIGFIITNFLKDNPIVQLDYFAILPKYQHKGYGTIAIKLLKEMYKSYDGMIHLAYLIAKRGDYSHFDFERRKSIFWAIFYFSSRVKTKIKTVIVDKKYINKKMQLNTALAREIGQFINNNRDYLESFDKIVIYYDNGQETLATILDTLFATNPKVERRIEFDHTKKRLFQVSDMLTVIDKLDYKRKNNIPFTRAEKYFFNGKDFRHIINLLKKKRI